METNISIPFQIFYKITGIYLRAASRGVLGAILFCRYIFCCTPCRCNILTIYILIGTNTYKVFSLCKQFCYFFGCCSSVRNRYGFGFSRRKILAGGILKLVTGGLCCLFFEFHDKSFVGSRQFPDACAIRLDRESFFQGSTVIAGKGYGHSISTNLFTSTRVGNGIVFRRNSFTGFCGDHNSRFVCFGIIFISRGRKSNG